MKICNKNDALFFSFWHSFFSWRHPCETLWSGLNSMLVYISKSGMAKRGKSSFGLLHFLFSFCLFRRTLNHTHSHLVCRLLPRLNRRWQKKDWQNHKMKKPTFSEEFSPAQLPEILMFTFSLKKVKDLAKICDNEVVTHRRIFLLGINWTWY